MSLQYCPPGAEIPDGWKVMGEAALESYRELSGVYDPIIDHVRRMAELLDEIDYTERRCYMADLGVTPGYVGLLAGIEIWQVSPGRPTTTF